MSLQGHSITSERSWQSGAVPEDWKRPNATYIFKNSYKEDPGNHTLISGEVMEQIILETLSKHTKDFLSLYQPARNKVAGGKKEEDAGFLLLPQLLV